MWEHLDIGQNIGQKGALFNLKEDRLLKALVNVTNKITEVKKKYGKSLEPVLRFIDDPFLTSSDIREFLYGGTTWEKSMIYFTAGICEVLDSDISKLKEFMELTLTPLEKQSLAMKQLVSRLEQFKDPKMKVGAFHLVFDPLVSSEEKFLKPIHQRLVGISNMPFTHMGMK